MMQSINQSIFILKKKSLIYTNLATKYKITFIKLHKEKA